MNGWHRFLPHPNGSSFRSEFAARFKGQTVCVTGAAGDIGSALVGALAGNELRGMVLLDSSEHGLFELQRQLEAAHPGASCEYVLGSVDDSGLLNALLGRVWPDIVFHAAAFKHIGLLEENPFAAIRNNAIGTYTLIRTALAHGIPKFVLLSTDKAVNPHSVMGVSKRVAELIAISMSCPSFRASAIRLGNVIGSRGSVVPVFMDQIANGRPLQVTHPEAARYFLSREEAVHAILAAGAAGCDGKILVPELASPVRIAELADFLIRIYGQNQNSTASFTALRPGEKITETLTSGYEKRIGTVGGPLNVIESQRIPIAKCEKAVAGLSECIADRDQAMLVRCLCDLVPEYLPSTLMRQSAAATA